jgi:hypothetical protein
MSYHHGMGQGPMVFTGRDIAMRAGVTGGGGGSSGGGDVASLVGVSALDALVPRDCQPPVMYAAPPSTLDEGMVLAYVWPLVTWQPRAAVIVPAQPPQSSASGGGYSYGGMPVPMVGGASVDVGPMKTWVQRMQAAQSVALAGFIPRPENNPSASKGVAWALMFVKNGSAPASAVANAIRTAAMAAVASGPLGTGGALPVSLGVGLPAVAPFSASALPAVPDWTAFADNWPRANAQILRSVLMVEGSFASLSAALSMTMTPNVGAPAAAIQQAAANLARLVTQGQAALSTVTAARTAAVRAAQSIPGIVSAAKQTMSAATDQASVDAAAAAAQQQIAALTASIPAWSTAITTATDVATQLGRAAASAATQFTADSILGMAITPSVQAAMDSARFEIAKNAVKCQVLMAIKGAATPAYAALMNNAGIARTLASQLATSAQSTALSGFAGLSGYRPRRKSWIQRMLGGLGLDLDLDLHNPLPPGLTATTNVPSIDALQSVATQAVTDITNAATTAKNAIVASAPPPGAQPPPGATTPDGTVPGTTPDGGFVIPAPTGPSVSAPSQVPWVWVGVGVAGVAGLGWFLFKPEKKVTSNRARARRRRAAPRRHSHPHV